jgi:hypothetical protein
MCLRLIVCTTLDTDVSKGGTPPSFLVSFIRTVLFSYGSQLTYILDEHNEAIAWFGLVKESF